MLGSMVGMHQALNQRVSFFPTTFRVWSQVQTCPKKKKKNLPLELVERFCNATCDIALGATQEGGPSVPGRKQRLQPSQREEVDPGCTQRPDVQTR